MKKTRYRVNSVPAIAAAAWNATGNQKNRCHLN